MLCLYLLHVVAVRHNEVLVAVVAAAAAAATATATAAAAANPLLQFTTTVSIALEKNICLPVVQYSLLVYFTDYFLPEMIIQIF